MHSRNIGLSLFGTKSPVGCLVLGSSKSGKTSIIKSIVKKDTHKKFPQSLNLVPQESKLPMFLMKKTLFNNNPPKGIIYVINSCQENIRAEKALIYDMLCHLPCKNIPILFLANFQGEFNSLTAAEINQYLSLPDVLNYNIIGCNGLINDGINLGLDWFEKEIKASLAKPR